MQCYFIFQAVYGMDIELTCVDRVSSIHFSCYLISGGAILFKKELLHKTHAACSDCSLFIMLIK